MISTTINYPSPGQNFKYTNQPNNSFNQVNQVKKINPIKQLKSDQSDHLVQSV